MSKHYRPCIKWYTKQTKNKKVRIVSNVNFEAIRARVTLKLGSLLNFIIIMHFYASYVLDRMIYHVNIWWFVEEACLHQDMALGYFRLHVHNRVVKTLSNSAELGSKLPCSNSGGHQLHFYTIPSRSHGRPHGMPYGEHFSRKYYRTSRQCA